MMKVIGLDVGNGSVCFAVSNEVGASSNEDSYQSVFAEYVPPLAEHAALGLSKAADVHVFSFGGRDYVLGYEAVRATGGTPISAYDREDRLRLDTFQTLTKLALLDAATRDGSHDVMDISLVLGVPVEDFQRDKLSVLERWFTEPIVGAKNGQSVILSIKYLKIISQPIAVLMDQYLTTEGYVADKTLESAKVLVIDAGSGTLDMTEFNDLAMGARFGEAIGMNDVYRQIVANIQRENPKVRVNVHDLEYQLRNQDGQLRLEFEYGASMLDITTITRLAMERVWTQMEQFVTARYPDRTMYKQIFVAGGTGQAFADRFRAWSEAFELVRDPQLSIARGMAKFGVWKTRESRG